VLEDLDADSDVVPNERLVPRVPCIPPLLLEHPARVLRRRLDANDAGKILVTTNQPFTRPKLEARHLVSMPIWLMAMVVAVVVVVEVVVSEVAWMEEDLMVVEEDAAEEVVEVAGVEIEKPCILQND